MFHGIASLKCIQQARKFGAECSLSKYRVITSSGAFGYIADELKKLCVIMLDKLENETATQRCIRKDVYRA